MFYIENDTLKIGIAAEGAELKTVYHKLHGLEYMWNADPAFWAKTSPVLFPIVGALKDNTFLYKGASYRLPRHGFAREKLFTLVEQRIDLLHFSITSDTDTLKSYPFPFQFSLIYTLVNDELTVTYKVENTGTEPMLFSVGGHPAFKVPLVDGTSYEDYALLFDKEETTGRWPISKDGLIEKPMQPLLHNTKELPLKKELFHTDAIVLKQLQSQSVKLTSAKTQHGLHVSFTGSPFLGLWAAPGANFLCIEPWCGIADWADTDQQFAHKEGIQQLPASEIFTVQWKARFY